MMLVFVIAGAFLVLGALAYVVAQWPEQSARKKKRRDKVVAGDPAKEAEEAIERAARRVRTMENTLLNAQSEQKEKLRQIDELKAAIEGLERQLEQEKAWRQREEAVVVRSKKQEDDLRAELTTTREALHVESNGRIKLEYEVKELRLVKDDLTADLRKVSGQNNDYERRVNALTAEVRTLKSENAKLAYKKEADQWVAKDDFVALEKQLKRAKYEVEQLQKRLPVELREVK